ncbi:two-component system, OmpR family, heavy metal sensor histidine kinase CusS [Kosakonia oryziphila]|uniref:Sensor protein n=1 Tax=Kosakonia oryziphila TaxID=1005667 RepID=A0A1C4BP05_9ENTR|nr:two-component system, OmpR family, heavy metal sensor histidine kinase CusS [Kosakonia oryziphila]
MNALSLCKHSIAGRMALMFAVAYVFIVVTFGVVLRSSLYESLQSQMHNELLFRESLMAPWVENRQSIDGWKSLSTKFNTLSSYEGGRVKYWLVADDAHFDMGGPPPKGVEWASLKEGFSTAPGETEASCLLFLYSREIPASGERPAMRYVVAIDSTPYMGTLYEFTRALVLASCIGVFLIALLGYLIARFGMRPVNTLSEQAHQLAPGNHGQRLQAHTLPDELQTLAVSFNGALERQEIAWRQLESFNADVAHELRTPLTNLIGQTQLGLSRQRSVEELQDLLESNLEELERMTSIVNDMLFLSHAQAGEHATQLTTVSLREEAYKTFEYVEPSFAEKNLQVQVEGDVTASIDRRLFHRSLANLLENSARHAPQGSTIIVRLKNVGELAHVAVSNHGEEIAQNHLARLFERFYRVDASRTRSDTHHGLGLSIVRAVANMHQGDVFATSVNGINTFGFTLALKREADNLEAEKR